MGIRRTRLDYEEQYTQIPNTWARDRRVSRRARGLLTEITSHRVGWRITIASLQEGGPEGRDAIRAGVQELIEAGYLVRSQTRDETGRMKEIEYELRDPFATADGKPDTGPDQGKNDLNQESTALSTGATAVGFPAVGLSDVGSADVGESDTKKNISLEEQEQEHQGGAAAPTPSPTCARHPNGTRRRCRACGDARRLWDTKRSQPAPEPPTATPRYDPDVFCEHLRFRAGDCVACEADARSALLAAGYQPPTRGAAA